MKELEKFILELARDYNKYSELVALNRKNKVDIEMLEWNRGNLNCIENYLKKLANSCGARLIWKLEEHNFGYDDYKKTLEYKTVDVEFNERR